MKNKTLASFLALFGGTVGLHRFYLHGWRDVVGWLLPWPSLIGAMGVVRARQFGLDDQLSWLLIPLLGFSIAASAFTAIFYGLTDAGKWNRRFKGDLGGQSSSSQTNGLTVLIVVCALLVGTTALIATLVYSFQHLFELQAL